jgi:hypothetical protein
MADEPLVDDRVFVSTIEGDPGSIHISIASGSGVDGKILRKELSLYEMQQMHLKLTAALWFRMAQSPDRIAPIPPAPRA